LIEACVDSRLKGESMKRVILVALVGVLLGLGGCASVPMQTTTLMTAPDQQMALVNFVRPRVFFGDGMSTDVWDGQNYIGALEAGHLIQYQAKPGKHLFMGSAENWSYVSADLQPGRQYIIKANIFPGVMTGRVALGVLKPDDPRRADLMALTPVIASDKDREAFGEKKSAATKHAVSDFEAGKVSSFATITFEDSAPFSLVVEAVASQSQPSSPPQSASESTAGSSATPASNVCLWRCMQRSGPFR
jgi:hypothetical protein